MVKNIVVYTTNVPQLTNNFSLIFAYYLAAIKNKKVLVINKEIFKNIKHNNEKYSNPLSKLIITDNTNENKALFDYTITTVYSLGTISDSDIFFISDLRQNEGLIDEIKEIIKNKNTCKLILVNYDRINYAHLKLINFITTNYGIECSTLTNNNLEINNYDELFKGKIYIKKKLIKIFN